MHSLLFIILLLLSSCVTTFSDIESQVKSLEGEIITLKTENANLKEENSLLRAGGDPSSIQTSSGTGGVSNTTTFTEGTYSSCMRDVHTTYISRGTEYCEKSGYSSGDILADKCQLEDSIMEELRSTKTKAEGECRNLYK